MFDGANLQLGLYCAQVLIFFIIQNIFLSFSILILISILFFILLQRWKNFFGDSGSLLIGFIIAYLVINQYNINPQKLSGEIIFLIMFLPGIDMFRLFILRLLHKKSFKPDRNQIITYLVKIILF